MFSSFQANRTKKVTKNDITELFYITSIENVPSILKNGLLSHRRAHRMSGVSDISNHGVQDRRKRKFIERPTENKAHLSLHQCVNLYLNPHNAMMAVRRDKHRDLCVLRISSQVISYPDVVLSTANAATNRASFMSADEFELSEDSSRYLTVGKSILFPSEYDGDDDKKEKHKQVRQAECLVPYEIDQNLIGGIFVSCPDSAARVQAILAQQNIKLVAGVVVLPGMFFANNAFAPLPAFKPLTQYNMPIYVEDDSVESSEELALESGEAVVPLKHRRVTESAPVVESDTSASTSSTKAVAEEQLVSVTAVAATSVLARTDFTFHPGEDLLKSSHHALVNTVNCFGVMGKGIALGFKQRFPGMFESYASECRQKKYKLGEPHLIKEGDKYIINFPTKNHWRDKSKLSDIEAGLIKLREMIVANKITSIALPPLGCGNGGLDWKDVYPLVKKHLADCGATIAIYGYNPELTPNLAVRAQMS